MKVREHAKQLPKELIKDITLKSAERSLLSTHDGSHFSPKQSPEQYASDRLEEGIKWSASKGETIVSQGSKKAAKKKAEKTWRVIKERRSKNADRTAEQSRNSGTQGNSQTERQTDIRIKTKEAVNKRTAGVARENIAEVKNATPLRDSANRIKQAHTAKTSKETMALLIYHDDEHIIKELQKINATYDKIAIWGNRDCGGGAARQYENIMQQSGFTVLKNENWYVTTDSDKKILFTGLDDSMLGNVYMPDSTKIYDSNYNILLIHEPDTADSFQEYPYDLVLSGHSHGGQVNIPFIPAINQKAISSTNLAKNYVSGMYELNSKTKIYVNTGIGTTHVSGRLGVVPEISIFHIYL